MPLEGAIFDLDGVITDTAQVHMKAWKALFDEYLQRRAERDGEPFSPFTEQDYLDYVDGMPRYDGVRTFLASRGLQLPEGTPEDGPDEETVCGLGNRKNAQFQQVLEREGAVVFPGSERLVRALRAQGVITGVASSSKNCKMVLERAGISDLFGARVDGVVLAEQNLPGKPDPAMFVTCAEWLGVSPARSLVVEDAISGVQAGRAGGFGLVIGVNRGADAEALRENGADWVVEDLSELTVESINEHFRES